MEQVQKTEVQKLDVKDLTDKKVLGNNNKGLNSNKLMLREKDVVVANKKALATLMNNYLSI